MFTIQDEQDLLPAIFDGPFEQPMWSTFLDRLRQRTRADLAVITLRPQGQGAPDAIRLISGGSEASRLHQRYLEEGHALDPLDYHALREERVYAMEELFEPDNPAHRPFVEAFLVPNGIDGAGRMVRVTEPGGLGAWLAISRAGADFTPADGKLLSNVVPHFRRALRAYAEIERQKTSSRIAADVLARLNFGWISLDAKGMILEQSADAAELLQHGSGLRRTRSGRLIAIDPAVDRRLSEAIRSLGPEGEGRPRAINVSHDPWVDLLLTRAHGQSGAAVPGGAIIAYIQGDNRSLAGRHEQLAELFGLLPSEARFALALGRGLSIAEAAESLGITLETARNYSKKVYAKMGARGQGDLIRFILTSVLALA